MRILKIVICLKLAKSASQPSSPRLDKSSNKQPTFSEGTQSQSSQAPETSSPTPKSNSSSHKTPTEKDNYSTESTQEATSSYCKKRKYQALRHYPGSQEKSNSEPSSPRGKRVEYDSDQLKDIRAGCNSWCSQPLEADFEVDFEELDHLIQEKEANEKATHLLNWEKEDWERAKRVEKRCKSSLGLYSIKDLERNVGPGLDALIWAQPEVMVYSFHPTKNLSPATVYAKRPKLHWTMQKPIPEDETLWRNSLRAYHKTRKKESAHHDNKHVGKDPKEGQFKTNGTEGSPTKEPSDHQGLTTLGHQGKSRKFDTAKNKLKHKQRNEKTSKLNDTKSLSAGSVYPQDRDLSPSSSQNQSWYQRGRSPGKAWFPSGDLSDHSSTSQSPRSSPERDKKKEIRPRVERPLARKVILRDPKTGGTPDIIVKKLYLVSDSPNSKGSIRRSPKKKAYQDSKASGNSSYTQALQTTVSLKECTEEDPSALRREIPLPYPESLQENGENSPRNDNFELTAEEVEQVTQKEPQNDNFLPYDLDTAASQLRASLDSTNNLIHESSQPGDFEDARTQQEDEKSQGFEDTYLEKDTEWENRELLETPASKSLDTMERQNPTYADAKAEPSRQRSTVLADFAMYKSDPLGTFNDTATDAAQVQYLQFTDPRLDKLSTITTSDAEKDLTDSHFSKTTDISEGHSLDCAAVVTTADAKDESPQRKTESTADPNAHHKLESLLDLLDNITTAATEDESDHPQSPRSTVDLDTDYSTSVDLHDTSSEADAKDESHQAQPSEAAYLNTDHSSDLHGTGSEADPVHESHQLQPCRTAALVTDRSSDLHGRVTIVEVKKQSKELQSRRTADLAGAKGLLDIIAIVDVKDEPHKLQSSRIAGLDADQSLLLNTTMADVNNEFHHPQSTARTDSIVVRRLDSRTTVNVMKTVDEPPHLQVCLTADPGVDHRLEPPAIIIMADTKDESHNLHKSNAADLAHIDNSGSLSTVRATETEYEPRQVPPSVRAYVQVDHTDDMLAINTTDTGKADESGFQGDKHHQGGEHLQDHAHGSQRKHHKRSFSEGSYNSLANSRFSGQTIEPPTKKPRMRDESSQVDFYAEVFTFQQERVTSTSDRDEQTQTSYASSEHGDSDLVSHRYVRPLARFSPNDSGKIPFSKPGLYQVLEPSEGAIGGKVLATSLIRGVSVSGENSQAASPSNPASPSTKHSTDANSTSPEKTFSCMDEILEYKDITNDLSTSKRNSHTMDNFYLRRGRSYRRSRVTVRSSFILRRMKDFGPGRQQNRRSRIIDGISNRRSDIRQDSIEDDILTADRTRTRPPKVRIHSFLNSITQRSGSVELNEGLRSLNPTLPEFSYSNSEDRISSLSGISSESSYDGNFRPGTPVSDLSRLSSSASEFGSFRARKAPATQATESTDSNMDGRNNSSTPNIHDGTENWQVSEQNSPRSETGSLLDLWNQSKGGEEGKYSSFSSVNEGNSGSGRVHLGRQSRVILRSSVKSVAMEEYGPGIPSRSSQTVDLSGIDDPGNVKFRRKRSSQVSVHSLRSAIQRGRSVELNNLIFRELARDPALRNRITFQSKTEDKRSPNNSSRSSSVKFNSPASPASDTENVNGTHDSPARLAFLDRETRTYGTVALDAETYSGHVLSLGTEIQQTEVFHSSVKKNSHEHYLVGGIRSPGAPPGNGIQDLQQMEGGIPSPGAAKTSYHEDTFLQRTKDLKYGHFHASYGIVIRQTGREESNKTDQVFDASNGHRAAGFLISKVESTSTSEISDAEKPNFTGKMEDHIIESSTSQGDDNQNQELMSNTASAMDRISQADKQNYGDASSSGQSTACLYNADEHNSLPLSPHQITVCSKQCSEPKVPQWMEKWKSDRFADFPPAPLHSVSRNQGVDAPPSTPSDGPPSTPPHQIEFLQAFWNIST
ncbi:hypothetical protein R1sor_003472 [Riccia sorocarpa]|uniref:Uncharacterized protein n=1 Tax=Riccia sorocarpa TaxID=122646 RepID=A0ABD3H534_9MARC